MSSTPPETPKLVAPFWESLLTGLSVGVVLGIGIGVVATSKAVVPTIAAGAAGAGVGSAIAYFMTDYRHTAQRNTLRRAWIDQVKQTERDRLVLQQQLEQSSATISQLQAELQAAHTKYDLLAETADAEVQRLQALIPADAVRTAAPSDALPDSIVLPAPSVTELQVPAEPATVS